MTRKNDVSKLRTRVAAIVALLAAFAVLSVPRTLHAHAVGLSTGEYRVRGASLDVKLVFARAEVASLLPRLDDNRDGHVTAFEIETAKKELETHVLGRIRVTRAGRACAAVLTAAALTEQDGLGLEGHFDCASALRSESIDTDFEVSFALLADLGEGHRHIARSFGAAPCDEILSNDHPTFSIAPKGAASPGASAVVPPAEATRGEAVPSTAGDPRGPTTARAFFTMGIEHILTGYDHLLFLLGIVLVRARPREMFAAVTAFTVAHSLTLALAVLDVASPRQGLIEPAIALSIVYVGIANVFVKEGRKRWRITFPFGLLHGFGFASALKAVALPRARLPVALVGFNLGVEAGQVLAMALLVPAVLFLRKSPAFEDRGVRVLSGAVALAGAVWFVVRVRAG